MTVVTAPARPLPGPRSAGSQPSRSRFSIGGYRSGRARPDGTLARAGRFAGDGEWSSPDHILMTVEVTSHDHDTDTRDRTEKRDGYAAASIPVYLLIDRDHDTLVVYSEPEKGRYRHRTTYGYGDTVALPGPVDITLESEELKNYSG
ncbi:Putative restriction endonuclease [Streptomyces sp. Termitarium-T10T-6]|nr:Uma2 family endonuclease [Streptomyces sp. Termitarium-T10T-6]SCD92802.1 Putative restriction endonuclease [Streptomyces sp. Termitarium-T10T-6]